MSNYAQIIASVDRNSETGTGGSGTGQRRQENRQPLTDFAFDDFARTRHNERDLDIRGLGVIGFHSIDRAAVECLEPDVFDKATFGFGKDFPSHRCRDIIDDQGLINL